MKYNPQSIEKKWQNYWESNKTFQSPEFPSAAKMYVLDMFPYPSANGLHVGHPEGYTATDIVCRYKRMCGVSVLHPMGWDSFGLPAEQQAKRTGEHPRKITSRNIDNFRRQLKMLGFSYDWEREFATSDPDYFRWTQWIFLLLYDTWYDHDLKRGRPISELPIPSDITGANAIETYRDEHRLAYQIEAPVNWCPKLGTVLSNEEVVGGVSERGGYPVLRLPLRQWMLRITAYADRLEDDLVTLDWSDSIKLLQRNWIGKSTGAEADFFIGSDSDAAAWKQKRAKIGFPRKPESGVLRIYTTRPDTLFGATYMVIAPEHPLVNKLTTPEQKAAVTGYCEQSARKSDLDRTDLAKEKSGVFTGSYAVNPVNGKKIPIWVADYVLISYGTGAIMAVPAHDSRDYEFASQFGLPIIKVVENPNGKDGEENCGGLFTGEGLSINSDNYSGMKTAELKSKITGDLSAAGLGRTAVNYKLRDWLFSRQHFWGEPFPLLHELDDDGKLSGRVRKLDDSELPLDIHPNLQFEAEHNSPEPPLEHSPDEWLYVQRDGKRYKRETNSMPQWAGSCWYYLRFIDPKNKTMFVDKAKEKAWMPIDLYVGGAEHAVLHLLYARFWHKVLYDYGYVSTSEPFQKLVNQGMILGETEFTLLKPVAEKIAGLEGKEFVEIVDGKECAMFKVDAKQVTKRGDKFVLTIDENVVVDGKATKMSKSRGNVINPDDVVNEYGADSLRLYEMFMGPLESVKPWSMAGVSGVRGFLDRMWRLIVSQKLEHENAAVLNEAVQDVSPTAEQKRVLHRTIKDVTQAIDSMSFNTAISKMMECVNFFTKESVRPKSLMEQLVLLLSPFAPHIAEELWELLGHRKTLAFESWLNYDEALLREATIEIPVQIGGKVRSKIVVASGADEQTLEQTALADAKIAELVSGKTIVKKIIVRGKMVNFVIK
ncbi:MAG: leucine--tRNA ligase [Planctomycetaceae bacterium]|jgi:leucyl-tRNA synthetase|nr:leucine--tRNA ligase [Planctomycetaceae bacterium]